MRRVFGAKAVQAFSVASAQHRGTSMSRALFCTSPALLAKVVPFNLADIGEGILHVEVLQWFVKPGDKIEAFDKICEVQSDKATVEITSRFDGVVKKLHIEKGAQAYVGKPLIDIETEHADEAGATSDAPAAAKEAAASSAPVAPFAPSSGGGSVIGGKALATPAVRRIAKENSIDIAAVVGSGKDGRVMKEDILAFIERGGQNARADDDATAGTPAAAAPAADRVVALTGVRKAMVRSMTVANAIPAFGASDEVEITRLIEFRDALRPIVKARDEAVKLSFMPMFLKAASLALTQFPELNAHTNADCSELLVKGSHNIGFALDSPNGLIVPVLKDCQAKSLFEIAREINELIQKGKRNAVGPEDMQGGTFTLSNIGSIGATYTKPVIFPPQVVIGAIGRTQKLPRFDDAGKVFAANVINVSWSADHRVVDGATMVRFSNLFRQYLENPATMVLDAR